MLYAEGIPVTQSETQAGTPILDLTADEYSRFLDDEVRARMDMSAREFTDRYAAGQLDDSDPDVPFLVGLLWIGQNGHNVVA